MTFLPSSPASFPLCLLSNPSLFSVPSPPPPHPMFLPSCLFYPLCYFLWPSHPLHLPAATLLIYTHSCPLHRNLHDFFKSLLLLPLITTPSSLHSIPDLRTLSTSSLALSFLSMINQPPLPSVPNLHAIATSSPLHSLSTSSDLHTLSTSNQLHVGSPYPLHFPSSDHHSLFAPFYP
ncbi:hypothetical protein XENTR_v10024839 [Xenopus tropicalis]|nr:hypothetical protein XENTR_v10024839 [Xenopus tropicalis]